MVAKGGLLVLILVVLLVRMRGCFPTGYRELELLMSYRDAEDTGLLGFYVMYSPPRPKKLSRCDTLLRTRTLILLLLLIGCIESHPGEFYKYHFYHLLLCCLEKQDYAYCPENIIVSSRISKAVLCQIFKLFGFSLKF